MPQSFATLSELSGEYLLTKEGRLGFVILRLAKGKDEFARATEATDALRDLIAQMSARHPETKIGLTGLPIMENDEMRSSQISMFWASLLSMIGVACLFVAGFGGMRHALLANAVLLLGMAWSFGFVTLAVGHLNILSVSFTVTLIGIGIDYGVYYSALSAIARPAPGVPRGAGSRFVRGWSCHPHGRRDHGGRIFCRGLHELYRYRRAGPDRRRRHPAVRTRGAGHPAGRDLSGRSQRLGKTDARNVAHPGARQPADENAALAALGHGGRQHRRIAGNDAAVVRPQSAQHAAGGPGERRAGAKAAGRERSERVVRAVDCRHARGVAGAQAQFLKLGSVERTEEIVSLLPADHEVKRPLIERIRQQLESLPERPPVIPVDRPEELGRLMARAQELIARRNARSHGALDLEQTRDKLRRMQPSECRTLVSQFQQQMAGDLLSRLHVLKSMANPEPPQLADLPESLTSRFVGRHGLNLLKIYGRGNIWDMEALGTFVHDVRTVDSRATGNPLQAYEASLEMKQSYQKSALYALVVITALLLFDFRSIRYTLLALLPLGVGLAQTFGLLGLLGVPLNPANMIALPILLGIGVDEGVHIVHDFLDQRGRYGMSQSTAVAVVVDSLTTIVGFGSLMIASHQGLQSLGRVLTIGVTCCLFTSMVMLPALLTWATRKRPMLPHAATADNPETRRAALRRRYDPRQQAGHGTHAQPATHRPEVRKSAA